VHFVILEMHMKILILHKSPILCQRLIRLLEETRRYEAIGVVGGVESVASALQLVTADHPAALLLDQHLDHGGALQMLAALEEKGQHLPVILLTDAHHTEAHRQILPVGNHIVLNKDQDLFNIVPVLDRLLQTASTKTSVSPYIFSN
jgi:DNA-binding NarL/FixJ family response regulator